MMPHYAIFGGSLRNGYKCDYSCVVLYNHGPVINMKWQPLCIDSLKSERSALASSGIHVTYAFFDRELQTLF